MKPQHSILSLCEALEASPSGYYDWQERRLRPGPRALENQALARKIHQLHQASRQTYGSPRILMELRKKGARHGRVRICRIMQQEGLCGR
jgi:putative transposase